MAGRQEPEEAARLIDAAKKLFHRAMMKTRYVADCGAPWPPKVANIDRQCMMLCVEQGKNGVNRDVPLNHELRRMLEPVREATLRADK